MVDESRDISTKEQMTVILHYVDNKGPVIERFMGVQHVTETTLSKLKESIDEFLKLHDLSYSNLQGQGYDGVSNMRAKKNSDVGTFCTMTNSLVNVVGCSSFDKEKLVRLAQMYPKDFTDRDRSAFQDQLDIHIHFVRSNNDFSKLWGINELAKKMVEKGLHRTFAYVYLLVQLALVLPVAIASLEKAFSAMNIIKGPLRNKMGDQWLSDSLVVYIEKYVYSCIAFIDQVAISRALNGIGLALVTPPIQSLVADSTDDNNRGMAFGWLQLTGNVG
ncbi:uncharacterized protein [Pyrus communis]|uniref:uncharacterized protein n=1 Tax=Pyrus communis TaxID=23211 RepID=UPI0035C03C4D